MPARSATRAQGAPLDTGMRGIDGPEIVNPGERRSSTKWMSGATHEPNIGQARRPQTYCPHRLQRPEESLMSTKSRIFASAWLAATLLSGCGGGSTTPAPDTDVATAKTFFANLRSN